MLERKEAQRVTNNFARRVVDQAKRNFKKKNASGKGLKSISFSQKNKKEIDLSFSMEWYMWFQDQGVQGKEKGRSESGFKYTNKRPPAKAFDKWSIRRGLAPRDAQGKFMSRQSLNFALANFIYKNGIKPSLFFTKAFEKNFKDFPGLLGEGYRLDIETLMEKELNAK